ncbi:AlkZ-related protein [Sodaliphilus pleomorphus]|uniref:AlkZ-related protein n=1 Tax=Sodaliphilus pleomorphus TaxID=2606626 RepID=UPI002409230E|nr:hypothetical protein [Sodaliphilus pleomorphus]
MYTPVTIHHMHDMERLIASCGFMPFFANAIPGFSIWENTPQELRFNDDADGPWEWKGPVILNGAFAYGKLLRGKAMYVTLDWYKHLANWRRAHTQPSRQELKVLDTIRQHGSLLTTELRRLCGYSCPRQAREGNPLLRESQRLTQKLKRTPRIEGLETCLTRLQMGTYLVVADFEYKIDKTGRRYGWGVARYCRPEDFFGPEALQAGCSPAESRERIARHLVEMLPGIETQQVDAIIG